MYFNKRKKARVHDHSESSSISVGSDCETIHMGDTVIVFECHNTFSRHVISQNGCLRNSYGDFHYSDMLGQNYGVKLHSRTTTGWCVALKPTPELWIKSIDKRTQVVHEMDCNFVTFTLDLKPGEHVIESGTGSGAMSLAICRCVAPTGRLFSYEFNASRVEEAKKDFHGLLLDDVITVIHRNVCDDGFCIDDSELHSIDAFFLDLPSPWLAVPHTVCMLKQGVGRLCSYSPCIEQAKKTVAELNRLGFHSIQVIETRMRLHDVTHSSFADLDGKDGVRNAMARPSSSCRGHTAYLLFANAPVASSSQSSVV